MSLPEIHRELLLEFIRTIVPKENNLPLSYRSIKKKAGVTSIKEHSLCKGCGVEIENRKEGESKIIKCDTALCLANRIGIKKNKNKCR